MAISNQYSPAQMAAMQKDAVRRVQEMQRQAKSRVAGQPVTQEEPVSLPTAESSPCPQPVSAAPLPGISEEALLLCILLLLFNEGTDGKLLLALLYVLLF